MAAHRPAPPGAPQALLRDVSRSFYLSIRLLPAPLRHPVGVAYLLARATDTVADSPAATPAQRRQWLAGLAQAIEAGRLPGALGQALAGLASVHPHAGEARLLARLGDCFDALRAAPAADRADVQSVLRHIVRGQALDVDRFAARGEASALPDADALEEYAYLVAGSVGEFWTDVCGRHLRDFARLPLPRMRELGRSFGTGLQLVNILRDAGEDLAAGRCYLPGDELAALAVDPAAAQARPQLLLPVWDRWRDIARSRIADGMAYADAVNSRRVRAAVALPALLGAGTLDRLQSAGGQALVQRVKVPRAEVRRLLARLALTLAGRWALRAGWDNRAP